MAEEHPASTWDLTQLFPAVDGPEIEAAFEKLTALVDEFEKSRPSLGPALRPAEFARLLDRLEEISNLGGRLSGYAMLAFSGDTQDQKIQSLLARVEQFSTDLENRTLFFELWLKELTDDEVRPFLEVAGDRRYWIESLRRFKPYTLSEPEEKIINLKDVTGIDAMTTLYDSLTNRYVFTILDGGVEKKRTRDQLMAYAHSPDPDLRRAAYTELYRVFGQDGPILGQMFQTMVRDWANENLRLRGHKSPMGVRDLANDLPGEVVGALLDVCRENSGLFQRFFRLKAKAIGQRRLRRYDIYAPVRAGEKKYNFNQALDLVREAFDEFDPALADMALSVHRADRLDALVRPGKRSGAFCASLAPRETPWVLMNFHGEARDVATLAHELGHAVHSILAADHSPFTFQAVLPLAENASTFGEMLLVDRLLAVESDPGVHRDLIFRQVDDAYATIGRQAWFSLFEQSAHDLVMQGATVDELAAAYLENLAGQFGEAVEVSDEFRWEWVSIPHFYHSPFYVYAYSFGQLLVFALYRRYKEDKAGFKPAYLDILRAGGSAPPMDILARAGLDVSQADFWRGGFRVVEDLVDRLEKMEA